MDSRARANRNEQYSRKTNVKIHGVNDVWLKNGRIQDIQTTVRQKLKSKVNVDVKPEDIIACHRIPGGSGDVRPVLLKVKNTEIESRIMRTRNAFRDDGVGTGLVDDVTKDNSELINKLNAHKLVESAWFFNCGVYVKLKEEGEQKVHTRVMFDINDDLDKKNQKTPRDPPVGRQRRLFDRL